MAAKQNKIFTGHAILFALSVTIVFGYKHFQDKIPNGNAIPNPCNNGEIWQGVGHLNPMGTGRRNQFGIDFKVAGMVWSRDICMKDSDGDGQTNGQELGDPQCVWRQGEVPGSSKGLSHPGICEPINFPKCKSQNEAFGDDIDCEENKPFCAATQEAGIRKKDIRFPVTPVPSLETNYHCMLFEMPSDAEYQLVATTPIIDNTEMVHHIIMFGCQIPAERMASALPEINQTKDRVYKCGMSPHELCQQIIGTWTVGSKGDCVSPNAGFRIGMGGYKYGALQVHWNNPQRHSGQTDSSGLTIYYTDKLRKYDSAVFVVGQEHLMIPPRNPNVKFFSTCPSDCTTEMLREPIYITRAVNHMHYLGKSQQISIFRNGKNIRDLTNDVLYSYDSPKFYHFDPPVEVLPGDEIRTTCVYNSQNSDKLTYFGAGTSDEMCYGFLTYYPDQSISPTLCASWKGLQRCHRYLPKFKGMVGQCKWQQFLNASDPETQRIFYNFYREENCGYFAKSRKCNSNCSEVVMTLSKHPCLQGDLGDWIKFKLSTLPQGQLLVESLKKCLIVNSASFCDIYRTIFVIIIALFLEYFATFNS